VHLATDGHTVECAPSRDDPSVMVRPLDPDDLAWKLGTLERAWGSTVIARLGELVDAAPLPGFVAWDADDRVGLLTYEVRADGVEVVTVEALVDGRGIGTALMDAVLAEATARQAPRLWLVTTNDNVRALAFYQRWGMNLVRLVRDGVTRSRLLKPSISTVGNHGIPRRHELELEVDLRSAPR
jgi:ribosomal protein S18 acetylase RimI-like enzyme